MPEVRGRRGRSEVRGRMVQVAGHGMVAAARPGLGPRRTSGLRCRACIGAPTIRPPTSDHPTIRSSDVGSRTSDACRRSEAGGGGRRSEAGWCRSRGTGWSRPPVRARTSEDVGTPMSGMYRSSDLRPSDHPIIGRRKPDVGCMPEVRGRRGRSEVRGRMVQVAGHGMVAAARPGSDLGGRRDSDVGHVSELRPPTIRPPTVRPSDHPIIGRRKPDVGCMPEVRGRRGRSEVRGRMVQVAGHGMVAAARPGSDLGGRRDSDVGHVSELRPPTIRPSDRPTVRSSDHRTSEAGRRMHAGGPRPEGAVGGPRPDGAGRGARDGRGRPSGLGPRRTSGLRCRACIGAPTSDRPIIRSSDVGSRTSDACRRSEAGGGGRKSEAGWCRSRGTGWSRPPVRARTSEDVGTPMSGMYRSSDLRPSDRPTVRSSDHRTSEAGHRMHAGGPRPDGAGRGARDARGRPSGLGPRRTSGLRCRACIGAPTIRPPTIRPSDHRTSEAGRRMHVGSPRPDGAGRKSEAGGSCVTAMARAWIR
jgi:hypothetical protein